MGRRAEVVVCKNNTQAAMDALGIHDWIKEPALKGGAGAEPVLAGLVLRFTKVRVRQGS